MPLKNINRTLAIDLGATNLRIAVVEDGKIIKFSKQSTPHNLGKILSIIRKEGSKIGKNCERVGVSVAGPVADGQVYLTNITGKWHNFREIFSEIFSGKPVVILNDAAAATIAEAKLGSKSDSLIYITISTGIGAGVLKNDKLINFQHIKEEIGHLKIDSEYQRVCKCGGMGHWEAFCSGRNLHAFFRLWCKKNKKAYKAVKYWNVERLFEEAKRKDRLALAFFDEVGRLNSAALAMLIEKYQPEKVVFGGAVAAKNWEIIEAGLKKYYKGKVPLTITNHGDEISLLGAALVAGEMQLEKMPVSC